MIESNAVTGAYTVETEGAFKLPELLNRSSAEPRTRRGYRVLSMEEASKTEWPFPPEPDSRSTQ
jgi:hypothetical protein